MGVKTKAAEASSRPLPIQGMMLRKKSGDGMSAFRPSIVANSNRLSRSTLHKIFAAMLVLVLLLYCSLMAMLMQHHEKSAFKSEGKWGPSITNPSTQTLRDHVKILQEASRKEEEAGRSDLQRAAEKIKIKEQAKDVAIDTFGGRLSPLQNLEEMDIHDMKPPEKIRRAKGNIVTPANQKVGTDANAGKKDTENKQDSQPAKSGKILRAYLEATDLRAWDIKPLPFRKTTADQLTVVEYPRVNSCQRLTEQFPIDDYPDADTFLPWIHDVFPTDDGKFIQFIAQNKRRCRTGTTPEETTILENMQPQAALFQHVPVKRIQQDGQPTRYQLTDHEHADADGIDTRFICRFHPSGQETLSIFNIQYDYASVRKGHKQTFTKEGKIDNTYLHTSQLVFKCPVPEDLVETIREGRHVLDDFTTLFVSLVPIRTPPRYGAPDQFLQPYYQKPELNTFSAADEWGLAHMLPRIEDSGRWENIPICLPTYKAFPEASAPPTTSIEHRNQSVQELLYPPNHTKRHRLTATTWTSTQYATRGERFAVSDGPRRLEEWIKFHFLVGVNHIIIYDNSRGRSSLKAVIDQFHPSRVTRVPWPASVCNNNKSFADSPGDRSSQYAADSSWRLRFGPHTDWMASMDVDEYLVPTDDYSSLIDFVGELDQNGTKIVSFGSWRAWPRRDLINTPVPIHNKTICDQPHPCFEVSVRKEISILQAYNCDRQEVKQEKMPAEKQIYRPDYVMQHFVHYSTITRLSQLSWHDTLEAGFKYGRIGVDLLSRFAQEKTEVTMLHTKSIATQDTAGWQTRCTGAMKGPCRIGVPWPDSNSNHTKDDEGWLYNCYRNQRIEEFWVPKLDKELEQPNQLR